MIIAPLKQWLIPYSINNPSDTNVYYVRAVISEAISGRVLITLNLKNDGTNFWSALWNTPADSSGTGYQIIVKTTVYIDSAYTQVSLVYGTQTDDHIIKDIAGLRVPTAAVGGGVDYRKIEEMIKKHILNIPSPKEVEKYDDTKVFEAIEDLGTTIQGVKDEMVLGSVKHIEALDEHTKKITNAIIETDPSEAIKQHLNESFTERPTHEEFMEMAEKVEEFLKSSAQQASEHGEAMRENLADFIKRVQEVMNKPVNLQFQLDTKPAESENKGSSQRRESIKKLVGEV